MIRRPGLALPVLAGLMQLGPMQAGPMQAGETHLAASNAQICARMAGEGRLGAMQPQQCVCFLAQGDRHMDSALARLWKEALLTGESREGQVAALDLSQARMERQMRRTLRDTRRKCGVANEFGF